MLERSEILVSCKNNTPNYNPIWFLVWYSRGVKDKETEFNRLARKGASLSEDSRMSYEA